MVGSVKLLNMTSMALVVANWTVFFIFRLNKVLKHFKMMREKNNFSVGAKCSYLQQYWGMV